MFFGQPVCWKSENTINDSPESLDSLTEREIEILKWLTEGKSSWDIGKILSISERTVKFHVNNICVKLNAVNRTHAVAKAILNNII